MERSIERFAEIMKLAYKAAQEIKGIDHVNWNISYMGDTEAVKQLATALDDAAVASGQRDASSKTGTLPTPIGMGFWN